MKNKTSDCCPLNNFVLKINVMSSKIFYFSEIIINYVLLIINMTIKVKKNTLILSFLTKRNKVSFILGRGSGAINCCIRTIYLCMLANN